LKVRHRELTKFRQPLSYASFTGTVNLWLLRLGGKAERLTQDRICFSSLHPVTTAVLVLCMNLGRIYTFHCRRKRNLASKWLGFLVNVWFWSALTLTLNQRVQGTRITAYQHLYSVHRIRCRTLLTAHPRPEGEGWVREPEC
jgi:hypothetical protein